MTTKQKTGTVVSTKMDITCIVAVDNLKKHSRYKKVFKTTKRYAVHDPDSLGSIGDTVQIAETRPISKTKNWILTNIVRKTSK